MPMYTTMTIPGIIPELEEIVYKEELEPITTTTTAHSIITKPAKPPIEHRKNIQYKNIYKELIS